MLTIFSIPKPFAGHVGVIQRNAVQSWVNLHPDCEVVLCANEAGTEAIAAEFNTHWLPDITCNEYGTPLLNSAFTQVSQIARHGLLCYVNADIILLPDLLKAIQRSQFQQLLITGRRWNLDLENPLSFDQPDWERSLRQTVAKQGTLGAPTQLDYFIFSKDSELVNLPSFAVGRPTWDNWFLFRARELRLPVVDITAAVMVIHQNHDYTHVPERRGKSWEGPEGDRNFQLTGGWKHIYTLADATHVMTPRYLLPAMFRWRYWLRLWQKKSPSWFPTQKQFHWWFNVFKNRLKSFVR